MIRGVIELLSLVVVVSWIIVLAAMTQFCGRWEVLVESLRDVLRCRGPGQGRWVGRWKVGLVMGTELNYCRGQGLDYCCSSRGRSRCLLDGSAVQVGGAVQFEGGVG